MKTFIRIVLCLAPVIMLADCCVLAQSAERAGDPELQMVLVPESTTYKLGYPILINIIYSNPSDHDIHYPHIRSLDQGDSYRFSVIQLSSGVSLERTDVGKEAYYEVFGGDPPPVRKRFVVGGGSWIILPPHKSARVETNLERTFKFTEPGSYRVEVEDTPSDLPVSPITIVVTR